MKSFGIAGLLTAAFALSAVGQDAVEIKIAYPKTGDRVKVTVEEKAETKIVATAMGQEQKKNEVKTKSLVYVDEAVENPANAKRPTKVNRTYEKAATGADGKSTALPLEGKTVVIEKKGEKYEFSVDGKAVEGESLKLLDGEFNKPEKSDSRELMFPGKPVKAGDTWKIDSAKLVKELADKNFTLDATKLAADGKLVKAYKQDGKQYGVIELKIEGPISDLGAKAALKLKEGKLSVAINGDGVIDGSSSQGKTKSTMKFVVSGSGDGFEMKVDATVTENRTVEALPKK
jgi:hypothetical protein